MTGGQIRKYFRSYWYLLVFLLICIGFWSGAWISALSSFTIPTLNQQFQSKMIKIKYRKRTAPKTLILFKMPKLREKIWNIWRNWLIYMIRLFLLKIWWKIMGKIIKCNEWREGDDELIIMIFMLFSWSFFFMDQYGWVKL